MRPDGHLGGNTTNLTVIADFEDNGAKSATRPPLSVALSLANRVAPLPAQPVRSLARKPKRKGYVAARYGRCVQLEFGAACGSTS